MTETLESIECVDWILEGFPLLSCYQRRHLFLPLCWDFAVHFFVSSAKTNIYLCFTSDLSCSTLLMSWKSLSIFYKSLLQNAWSFCNNCNFFWLVFYFINSLGYILPANRPTDGICQLKKGVNLCWLAFHEQFLHLWTANAASGLKCVIKFPLICSDLIGSTLQRHGRHSTVTQFLRLWATGDWTAQSPRPRPLLSGLKKQNEKLKKKTNSRTSKLLCSFIRKLSSSNFSHLLWWVILGNNSRWLWRD